MTHGNAERATEDRGGIDGRLRSHGIRLGDAQRRRLDALVRRCGDAVVVGDAGTAHGASGVAIVTEPPSGAGAELMVRGLRADAVVVMPFGENPAFDFLKSKMTEFGTVGPCGADGPHEMWWGGLDWPILEDNAAAPLVVSCHPATKGDDPARLLKISLARLALDGEIEPVETADPGRLSAFDKAGFIARMWRRHRRPLLFVEADSILRRPPLLPAQFGCDVALHKWNRWEMSARTLYFGRTAAAEALLDNWLRLAATYPDVWDGYVLDQAWSLTSSQVALDTLWLPRFYHALAGDAGTRRDATIVHNLPATTAALGPDPDFAALVQSARRAGRTGARDSLIVLTAAAPAPSRQAVTVILRDLGAANARAVASCIDQITEAYAADCGGFGRLELSLCPWREDVRAATESALMCSHRVLEITPRQHLPGDLFRLFAQRHDRSLAAARGGR
jgi:hypothetical protein